jgi:hypothetical protein
VIYVVTPFLVVNVMKIGIIIIITKRGNLIFVLCPSVDTASERMDTPRLTLLINPFKILAPWRITYTNPSRGSLVP